MSMSISMSKRKRQGGFTLVELLVVIAIIGVLAGMIVGIVGMARQRAFLAKAKSNISAISVGLEAYNTLTGIYPTAGIAGPSKDAPDLLFIALYTGAPKYGGSRENHLADWPAEQLGKWPGSFVDIYEQPNEEELDFTHGIKARSVFLDPWGRAYHFAEFDSREQANRKVGDLKAKGGQSYAIWSDGPNKKNDWGKEDDVTSWSEGAGSKMGSGGGKKTK